MDYSKIGLDAQLRKKDSLAAQPSSYEFAIKNDLTEEKNPLKQNIIVTKQLYQSNLGGSVQFLDTTGGTVILSYNPDTGTITLNGGVVVNQIVNFGTVTNAVIQGGTVGSALFTTGTLNNPTIGTPTITKGTLNSVALNGGTLGTARFTGITTFDTNFGSMALGADGQFNIQHFGTAAVLAVRMQGTTFYFNPTGTL